MFEYLFREFLPYKDALFNERSVVIIHIIGGILISITFFAIGIICLTMASLSTKGHASRRRVVLTKMFGMFLISCAFARIVDLLCIWHNYATINGIMKVMTGVIALSALIYIPAVIKESLNTSSLEKVDKDIAKVKEDIEKVKDISRKL